MVYKVVDIVRGTTVDGPGFRTSIYLAGCNHHCPGCHNPQTWDPDFGRPMNLDEIMDIVEEEDFDVTLSGGDPLLRPDLLKPLIEELKKNRRNVWIYTGYTWEEIIENQELLAAVEKADVLVDGPYIEEYRDPDLWFRGSSNQRLIDIPKSLEASSVVLYSKIGH